MVSIDLIVDLVGTINSLGVDGTTTTHFFIIDMEWLGAVAGITAGAEAGTTVGAEAGTTAGIMVGTTVLIMDGHTTKVSETEFGHLMVTLMEMITAEET